MSFDIDQIWLSLKEDCSIGSKKVKAKSIAHLWESRATPLQKERTNRKTGEQFQIDSLDCHKGANEVVTPAASSEPVLINAIKSTDSPSRNMEYNDASDGGNRCGDSDDDSDEDADEESLGANAPNPANMKIERIANMLQSSDRNERLAAIENLEQEIQSLQISMQMTKVPQMDYPPPYNVESIALTHKQYGATVSDLAKGDHVVGWNQWQRTQVPISKQFPRRSSETNDSTTKDNGECSEVKNKLQAILNICGTALFKRFADPSEKCRISAIECVRLLCLSGLDTGKHIAYLMPAIFSRYPETQYDVEMKLFVMDVESHVFYKRGGATQRQDRKNLIDRGGYSLGVGEPCEEIRLALCDLLSCIIRSCLHLNVLSLLDAYFSDMILAIQSHLNDAFPKLKIAASELLVQIIRVPSWEDGAKHYATAIARAALPNLRNRSSQVRVASLGLFEASVSVPDRDKIKGAGTEAITDLVGFREDNVLPIAAFYKAECGVTVNSLAELMIDKNAKVRHRCCQMLSFLICCLPDRYDYHQRLLPYLLSFINDENNIRDQAMMAIENCGQQYEAENPNEIIERRQYGVDGDGRCNHIDKLPPQFEQRPRIGARLFVRGNTKRFFAALLSELRNWIPQTRHQSAKLLHSLVFYCEEHLTMDFHNTLAGIVKALQACLNADDKESTSLQETLESLLKSMGRYVDPDTYVKLLVPRIIGDVQSGTSLSDGGVHAELSCVAHTIALRSLISGSLPRRVLSHFYTLLPALSAPTTLGNLSGNRLRLECLIALDTVFERVKNHSIAGAQTAHFETTGRLCSSNEIMKTFKASIGALLEEESDKAIIELATKVTLAIPKEFENLEISNMSNID